MTYPKPLITNFQHVAPLMVQKYERYLPTAFDDSMTMLEKMDKIIQHLNKIGEITNGVVEQWNEVMEWVMNEGLTQAVIDRLNIMIDNGEFDTIINQELLNSKSTIIISKNMPVNDENTTIDNTVFWYQVTDTPVFSGDGGVASGSIYVNENPPDDTSKLWYDVKGGDGY